MLTPHVNPANNQESLTNSSDDYLKKQIPNTPYVKQYYAIEEQYGIPGIIHLLKTAAATHEQIKWLELPEETLHKEKSKLENEMLAIQEFNHKLSLKLTEYENQLSMLKPWEKISKANKIKQEIESTKEAQKEVILHFERIAQQTRIINSALEAKATSQFSIELPSTSSFPKIEHIFVIPLRQEIAAIKTSFNYQNIITYCEKEHSLTKEEQKKLKMIKEELFNSLLFFYKKADFYLCQAREHNLPEKRDFELIKEELGHLTKTLFQKPTPLKNIIKNTLSNKGGFYLDSDYITHYKLIEKNHGTEGIKKLLRIASATNEEIYWMQQKRTALLDQKKHLEKEYEFLKQAMSETYKKQKYYELYYTIMSPSEQFSYQEELEKVTHNLQEELYKLNLQLTMIHTIMSTINHALELQESLCVEVKPDSIYFSQQPQFLYITPIRLEISILKEAYHYDYLITYQEKVPTMQPQEQERYAQAKQALLTNIATLLKKTDFYITQEKIQHVAESKELQLIHEELCHIQEALQPH